MVLSCHLIEGEKKTYITTPLINYLVEHEFVKLNPQENRKIIDEIYRVPKVGEEVRGAIFKEAPQLQRKYLEMRKQFGLAFIETLSAQKNGHIREYLSHLQQLGFRDFEIREIAETFLDRKN